MIYLIMGVSGSGKTTIGERLAKRLGCQFSDADQFHSEANRKKMAEGTPLNDDDRWPWLDAIRAAMQEAHHNRQTHVFACSALKKQYRERLQTATEGIVLVFLNGPAEVLSERILNRRGHFFDPRLLQSQIDTLEPPSEQEALLIDVRQSPDEIIDVILQASERRQ
ncbi:gluconokinase [Pseudomonas asuensis]|jgi:gluconokinase|uniref:Gluconokinase n=1 Tax=Pseudomonas asuensis TaxID=1825787 RepID=A0ABQ2GI97_9PSED|nr:gluconokinase [Pseudomonas asuensis]GGL96814.1 gluconokinase [Pseudomonas asuensis]